MSNEFNLTAPEPPEPLPRGVRFVDWQSLVSHTILAVIDEPIGKLACDTLIITETLCWLALDAEQLDCGDAHVQIICRGGYGYVATMVDYASPTQLLRAGVITPRECIRLEDIRDEEKKQQATRRVQQLRAELARLEGERHE